jgi:hypothetical protein
MNRKGAPEFSSVLLKYIRLMSLDSQSTHTVGLALEALAMAADAIVGSFPESEGPGGKSKGRPSGDAICALIRTLRIAFDRFCPGPLSPEARRHDERTFLRVAIHAAGIRLPPREGQPMDADTKWWTRILNDPRCQVSLSQSPPDSTGL